MHQLQVKQDSLALASMARDDSPASSTAAASSTASSTAPASSMAAAAARQPQCAVKWDRNLKPKLAIMHQCTSITDRWTDRLASWHKHEMYILHLALTNWFVTCHVTWRDCSVAISHHWLMSSVYKAFVDIRVFPSTAAAKLLRICWICGCVESVLPSGESL